MQYEIYEKYKNYKSPYCWQYQIRLDNYKRDLEEAGLTEEEVKTLKVSDFDFSFVPKSEKVTCNNINKFIEKHEWLGKVNMYVTHRFLATYKGKYAGVILMSIPNSFSYILGEEYKDAERLISRGACISWSPKNLNSALLMWSIRWMVKHTSYRIFTAYSDPEAKELGTIYQACNFYYLGQNYGSEVLYFDPSNPQLGWFNERMFRKKRMYKRYAKDLNIVWKEEWDKGKYSIDWSNVPLDIMNKLKDKEKEYINSCIKRTVKPKHKYLYLLGQNKKETKYLRNLFKKLHPELYNLPYPKIRGE